MWLSTNIRQGFVTGIKTIVSLAPGKSYDSLIAIDVTLRNIGEMDQHQPTAECEPCTQLLEYIVRPANFSA